jgi:hypothetical protein
VCGTQASLESLGRKVESAEAYAELNETEIRQLVADSRILSAQLRDFHAGTSRNELFLQKERIKGRWKKLFDVMPTLGREFTAKPIALAARADALKKSVEDLESICAAYQVTNDEDASNIMQLKVLVKDCVHSRVWESALQTCLVLSSTSDSALG